MKTSSGKGKKDKATIPTAAKNGPQLMPDLFPIVGIGASAGGLEAFSELLHNLPEKTGMAFVLVQHLDPKHESALPEILGRTTKLPVEEVTDGTVVQPNHVYVIPANTSMMIDDGALQLRARTTVRGQHMPIDNFFFARWQKRSDTGSIFKNRFASSSAARNGRIRSGTAGGAFAEDGNRRHPGCGAALHERGIDRGDHSTPRGKPARPWRRSR